MKSIQITLVVWKMLSQIKLDRGLGSYNEVIMVLLDYYGVKIDE